MTYVLDANVFIEAKKRYYGFDICPGFWTYLEREMTAGTVRSLDAIQAELVGLGDDLSTWAKNHATFFDPPGAAFAASMARVSAWVTGPELQYTRAAVTQFLSTADSVLVAHALAENQVLVTEERSDSRSHKRVKIPDACNAVGVTSITTFAFLRAENVRFGL